MSATTARERDSRHLLRAIELAGRARGQTSPNPIVGAVLVKEDRVIGEGVTQPPGQAHAERMALADCTEDPAGATLTFDEWYRPLAEKEMKDVKVCLLHTLYPSVIHSKREIKSVDAG